MHKRIAVQSGLDNIKSGLDGLGYEVVDINDSNSVEAVVYMADGYNINYHNQLVSMNEGEDISGNKGVMLINATGKTVEQIDYIINNRIYSPLFE